MNSLNNSQDFLTFVKYSERDETTSYLSCDFSRPGTHLPIISNIQDIGIVKHFPMYKLAAVSDIVYGSLQDCNQKEMIEKFLHMKYIDHEAIIPK